MDTLSTPVKIAIAAGVTVAAVGVGYYLLNKSKVFSRACGKRSVDQITKAQVISIIDEIAEAQNKMKTVTQKAIGDVISKNMSFDQTYDYCLKIQPADPLQKYGLTTGDFDLLLDREQHDHTVRERLAKIMGMQDSASGELGGAQGRSTRKSLDAKELISIHEFMLEQLRSISGEVESKFDRAGVDMRALAVAAQVLVGAKVQQKFGVDTDDIETSIIKHHDALSTDVKFATVNDEIQKLMAKFFDIQAI